LKALSLRARTASDESIMQRIPSQRPGEAVNRVITWWLLRLQKKINQYNHELE